MQKNIKKWIQLIAIMLAMVMLAGCNLIATDRELDAKMTVLEVGGEPVTKAELADMWVNVMNYWYQMLGGQIDTNSPEVRQDALEQAIDAVVAERVVVQRGMALGLDQFTEEELAELEAEVQTQWDEYADRVREEYFAASELEGDALTEAIDAQLEEMGLTQESMLDTLKDRKIPDRVWEYTVQDVVVTPEEVAQEYQGLVDEQKAAYELDITAYASDRMGRQTIYFVPAGYRYVKHVLLRIDAEASAHINAIEAELSTLFGTLGTTQAALRDLEPPATEPTDEEEIPTPTPEPLTEEETAERAETVAVLQAQITELEEAIATKQAELELAQAEAFDALSLRVEDVKSKIDLGLNFDRVIETYGEDTRMTAEPFKSKGYPVIEGLQTHDQAFGQAFQDAAMALEQVGDVSDPVQSGFGFHIIKYVSDSVEHEVGLDAVREEMTESLLTNKQNEVYQQELNQWIEGTKVRRFNNRMDFI
ncbi:MAG: SurA N-terminal domain-containing protein [Clostridia bacterium]|nr:SurA N-terminal domain-containing protein [Clostridia bacterium]